VKLKPTLSLLLGLFAVCFAALAASAGDVTLLGSERIVFSTLFGNSSYVTYPCGNITRTATGWNYSVDNEPYFDGPISPIAYPEGGATKLRFNASDGYRNYQIVSDLSGSGDGATFTNGVLDCAPIYTGSLDYANNTFAWGEWLYGTFRDVPSGKVYSHIYNEYYGGYYPGRDSYGVYVASGLAVSTNNGASFSKILAAPNHVILRSPDLRQNVPDGQGYSGWPALFKSPLDQMYYMAGAGPTGTTMMRTNNLDDPLSWRAWDGSAFSLATVPLSGTSQTIEINPLYLGYSDYFKKYMAVTIGSSDNYQSGNNLIVYNLSDDLVHWGPPRKIMYNPACGPDHVCDSNDVGGELGSYPSIMDPGFLSETGDSTKTSNGVTGIKPLVTYIKDFSLGSPHRQEFAVQQVNFDQVVFNRMDNFSMRGVVDSGNRSLVMGFIMQGAEPKKFVFRGIGPSLPTFSYPRIGNPRISLYDGAGNLLAVNAGWRSLSGDDQTFLISQGLNPSNDAESAIVATLPGSAGYTFYTIKMDNGYGMGVIESYDMSSTAESRIAEVSVRGYSQPGDGALIMAFISRGGQQAIVRGTGTSTLAPVGFSPVIPDPYISVYNGTGGLIISNDNWGTDPSAGVIQSYGLAPGNSAESATLFSTQTTLPARYSVYSVQLQGTGYGLLELYNVNPN
jgi:hypothetical protein